MYVWLMGGKVERVENGESKKLFCLVKRKVRIKNIVYIN